MTDEQIGGYSSERLQLFLGQNPNNDPNAPITKDIVAKMTSLASKYAMSPDYPTVELKYLSEVFGWLREENGQESVSIADMPAEEYVKKLGAVIFAPVKDLNAHPDDASTKTTVSTRRSRSHGRLEVDEGVIPTELVTNLQLSQDQMPEGFESKIDVFSDIDGIIRALLDRRTIDEMTATRLIVVTGVQELAIRNAAQNNNYIRQNAIAEIRYELKGLISQGATKEMKYPTEWETGHTFLMLYLDYAAHNKNSTVMSYMQTIADSFSEDKLKMNTRYLLACIGYSIAAAYQTT